jgi:hypothetical protein
MSSLVFSLLRKREEHAWLPLPEICSLLSVNLSAQPILPNQNFSRKSFPTMENLWQSSPQKTIFQARDRSDSQEPGWGAVGVTAMARPTCAGMQRDEPPRWRQGDPGGFAEEDKGNRGVGWGVAFLGRSGAFWHPEQRGNWTKGRRRGSFSGRGNDQTNTHQQTFLTDSSNYQQKKVAADPRDFCAYTSFFTK